MGEFERALDAPTISLMDQVEAFSIDRLRELVRVHKDLCTVHGADTSPLVLATMIADSAEDLAGNTDRFIVPLANILGAATKVLIQLGWPENESLPIAG